jgi:hypothetical protein
MRFLLVCKSVSAFDFQTDLDSNALTYVVFIQGTYLAEIDIRHPLSSLFSLESSKVIIADD